MQPLRKLLKSKIHRAKVTHADIDYEGSITLSPTLMAAADIAEYEAVQIWNLSSATRFETYVITGEENTSDIAINGAAAHLAKPGDLVIVACFINLADTALSEHKPKLIFVDDDNQISHTGPELAGPQKRLANS